MPTVLLSGPNFRYQREASNVIVSYRGNSPVFIDVGPVAVTVRVGYGGSLMAVERPPAETPLSETPSPEQTFLVVYSERSSVLVTNREDTHVFRWGEVQIDTQTGQASYMPGGQPTTPAAPVSYVYFTGEGQWDISWE